MSQPFTPVRGQRPAVYFYSAVVARRWQNVYQIDGSMLASPIQSQDDLRNYITRIKESIKSDLTDLGVWQDDCVVILTAFNRVD